MKPWGMDAKPSPFRRSTIACTGIEICKLAFVETKGLAARVIDDMEQRLADVEIPTPISLHINGCPNSCARIQTADIGLKGQYIGFPMQPQNFDKTYGKSRLTLVPGK